MNEVNQSSQDESPMVSLLGSAPDKEHFTSQETIRILLANSCSITRNIIAGQLLSKRFDIVEAETKEQTLQFAQDINPDLILLDAYLGDDSGLSICQQLKGLQQTALTPIIFLSNKMDRDFIVSAIEAGASDYITKPFDAREALARINMHVHIRRLTQAKEQANQELVDANHAKDRLLGITSHDLRNPVYAIRGIIQSLKTEPYSEKEKNESYDQIEIAADAMIELLEDLVDFTTLEHGKLQLNRANYHLSDFIEHLVAFSRQSAAAKNIQLCFKNNGLDNEVLFDEKQIRRVILNLISNAIKYSPRGGIVVVSLEQSADTFIVAIEDEGKGIPQEEQSKLFKEYGVTSVRATNGEKSTGLGLCICKKIIEAHGGIIQMRNRQEGGASFYFTLPGKHD